MLCHKCSKYCNVAKLKDFFHATNLHTVWWAKKVFLGKFWEECNMHNLFIMLPYLFTDRIRTVFTAPGKTWCQSKRTAWRRWKTWSFLSASYMSAPVATLPHSQMQKYYMYYISNNHLEGGLPQSRLTLETHKIKRMKGNRHIFSVHLLICWWTYENCMTCLILDPF